jgi:DnaJ-class molecular chaperone
MFIFVGGEKTPPSKEKNMDARIKKICSRCRGTKVDDNINPPAPCSSCEATGYTNGDVVELTELSDDITICKRRLKKIMDKLEITE